MARHRGRHAHAWIRLGGGKVGVMFEYRLVPMMISAVKIGEELSQAALTRGSVRR